VKHKTISRGIISEEPCVPEIERTTDLLDCDVCQKKIPRWYFSQHCKTIKHQKNLGLTEIKIEQPRKIEKVICDVCGGEYSLISKSAHLKTHLHRWKAGEAPLIVRGKVVAPMLV
jgi:hypothetical protein